MRGGEIEGECFGVVRHEQRESHTPKIASEIVSRMRSDAMFPVAFANQSQTTDTRAGRPRSSPRRQQPRAREIVRVPAAWRTNKAPDRPTTSILSDRRDAPEKRTNDQNADRASTSLGQSAPSHRSPCAYRSAPSLARRDILAESGSRPQRLQGRCDQCRWGVRANENASVIQLHRDDAALDAAH